MKGQQTYRHISEDACKALESIVGHDHFSDDPVICAAYHGRGFDKQVITFNGVARNPAAVIQPRTTEEVAAIIKACNRYDIPYVPMSTYGMAFGGPNFRDDILFIDLNVHQAYLQNPPIFPHGMGRVGAQIHHHLMDLRRIGQNHIFFDFNILSDFNRGGQRRTQHF